MVARENTHDAYVLYVSFGTDQVTREKQSGGGATLHHFVLLLGLFLLLPTCSPAPFSTPPAVPSFSRSGPLLRPGSKESILLADTMATESGDTPSGAKEFEFPFSPYAVQVELMNAVYSSLNEGQVGIFESPTGMSSVF